MANLTRWDPFREMSTMRNLMNRIFDEEVMPSRLWSEQGQSMALPLDVSENQNAYVVKASIPGIDPDNIEITLHDNLLTIRGEMQQEDEKEDEQYHLRERRFGSFMRSISLPAAVNSEQVEAICENGVLTLTIPKTEESKPRRISIGASSRTIEGQTSGQQSNQANSGQMRQGQNASNQTNRTQPGRQGGNEKSGSQADVGPIVAGHTAPDQTSRNQSSGSMEGRERSG